jgi:hypothetical protein
MVIGSVYCGVPILMVTLVAVGGWLTPEVLINVAVTAWAESIVTVHAPFPEHAPPHASSEKPVPGAADRETVVPPVKLAVHVALHAVIPDGVLVTVPYPVTVTVKAYCRANVAVMVVSAVIVRVHVDPDGVHPAHPANADPAAGVAVSVIAELKANEPVQVVPQEMPPELLVTVPVPEPVRATVSVYIWAVNVAVTDCASLMVTMHVPVPEHPEPLHPVNADPEAAVAVRVTNVP